MSELHFLRPLWLLALLALPGLWLLLKQLRQQRENWHQLMPAHLHKAMLISPQAQSYAAPKWPWVAAVLALITLAGPSWQKQEVPVFQLNHGRVLVMDMSYSMYATDLPPNRLTQSRYKAIDLMRRFDEGETALIAYAGDAFALAPLTDDKETLLNLVPNLSPEIMPVPGSDLPSALELANQLLRDAGYHQGEIILFIDGINPEHADESLKLAASYPWTLKVYALGSEAGAPMRAPSGELVKSRSGEVVIAQTNLPLLGKLADTGSGELISYRGDDQDVEQLARTRSNDEKGSEEAQRQTSQWQDMGVYLLPLLLLPAAISLRRQWAMALLPLLLLSPTHSDAAWWQSNNAQVQQLLNDKQYAEAAERLPAGAPKADALYRAGDYQGALEAYQQLPESAETLYNQGNALAQMQQFERAKEAYSQALERKPELTQAQENLELIEQLQQQQQQQQQQGENEQKNDDQQQGNQPGSNQDSASEQENAEQEQQGDDSQQSGSDQQDSPQQSEAPSPDPQQAPQPSDSNPQPESEQGEQTHSDTPADAAQREETKDNDEAQPLAAAAESSTSTNDEAQQVDPQVLERIPDDPSILLRNKMKLEYERRRRAGKINEERTQW